MTSRSKVSSFKYAQTSYFCTPCDAFHSIEYKCPRGIAQEKRQKEEQAARERKVVEMTKRANPGNPVKGHSFNFTGVLITMGQSEAEQAVRKRGGFVHPFLKGSTDYLVVGLRPMKSGADFPNCRRIDEREFLRLLGRGEQAEIEMLTAIDTAYTHYKSLSQDGRQFDFEM